MLAEVEEPRKATFAFLGILFSRPFGRCPPADDHEREADIRSQPRTEVRLGHMAVRRTHGGGTAHTNKRNINPDEKRRKLENKRRQEIGEQTLKLEQQ